MTEEIKLGWYRLNEDWAGMFNFVEVVCVRSQQLVYATKECGLRIEEVKNFIQCRSYIGTELGEWVEASEVSLSELPMQARTWQNECWRECELLGYRSYDRLFLIRHSIEMWAKSCQVWRVKR